MKCIIYIYVYMHIVCNLYIYIYCILFYTYILFEKYHLYYIKINCIQCIVYTLHFILIQVISATYFIHCI